MPSGYGLGLTAASMVYFGEAGVLQNIPPPRGRLLEAAEARDLASGGVRWVGYPTAAWYWDYFEAAWYDILHTILPNPSGIAFIQTSTNDNLDEFQVFRAKYIWPLELDKDMHFRMGFEVLFRRAIELSTANIQLDRAMLTALCPPILIGAGIHLMIMDTATIGVSGWPLVVTATIPLNVATISTTGQPITLSLT